MIKTYAFLGPGCPVQTGRIAKIHLNHKFKNKSVSLAPSSSTGPKPDQLIGRSSYVVQTGTAGNDRHKSHVPSNKGGR